MPPAGVVHRAFTLGSRGSNSRAVAAGEAQGTVEAHGTTLTTSPPNGVVRVGDLELRADEHTALLDGVPLVLTVREHALLSELATHPDRVLTREELYAAVWGGDLRASDRSVDVYVSRLRAKLAAVTPGMRFIHTHFGIGYRFSPGQ
jgi:DNA-binding response OmpR family regulator